MSGGPASDEQAGATGEALDELGDDAIVAQQSQPHSPAPRAQVSIETRSVVIASDAELGGAPKPPEAPPPRQQLSTEPTLVIRDRKMVEELRSLRPPEIPEPRHWSMRVIWVSAAILAFGLGGLLALLSRSGGDGSEPTAAVQETFVTPAPQQTVSAPPPEPALSVAEPEPPPGPSSSSEELTAVTPPGQSPRSRAPVKRPKPTREVPAPAPAPPAKAEIPPGI